MERLPRGKPELRLRYPDVQWPLAEDEAFPWAARASHAVRALYEQEHGNHTDNKSNDDPTLVELEKSTAIIKLDATDLSIKQAAAAAARD